MEATSLLGGIAQAIDFILRELSAFLKEAAGFLVAVAGYPSHVFGQDAALFMALAILFTAGAALGGFLWWAGRRVYKSAVPLAEIYFEEYLEQRRKEEARKALGGPAGKPNEEEPVSAVAVAEVPAGANGAIAEVQTAKAAYAEPILDRAGPL